MELLLIIWSIILNSSFVYVWSNKEKLKKWKPIKVKEDKNNEVILGKINGFTIFNCTYILLTSKVCFELLKSLGKLSRLEIYITNHLNFKILGVITDLVLDSKNFITLFVGLTGMLVAIYIYAVGIDNKLKKFMLITLLGKEELFYLSFNIVILFFLWSKSIFLIGPIGYLIYLLTNSVKWILKINSESSYKEIFQRVLKDIFMGKSEDIKDLYIEVKKSLYSAVKSEELMEIEENKYYFNKLLDKFTIDLKGIVENDNRDGIIRFLYDLYDVAYRNKNDNIFQEISFAHIKIAKYYLRNNDKENFYWSLHGMTKVYDYHYRSETDKFELRIVDAFRFDYLGIWKKYNENFEEGIEWYSQMFKVITEGIKKAVENEDFYFFQQFIYLIGHQFKHKKKLKKDYKLLERSVYFGILMYLKEEKRKSKDNEDRLKKMDEYIEIVEKFLSSNSIIDLIELYEFIDEEIYGWNEEYRDRLNWDKYYERRNLIRVSFDPVRTEGEKDKLFFELLGKVNYSQYDKNILLNNDDLEEYFERKSDKDTKKSTKRINKFKKNAGYLLGSFQNYKENIAVEEKNYNEIEILLKELVGKNKQERDESIRGVKISKSKIELTKIILIDIMKESSIIKMLKGFNKYKLKLKEKNERIQCLGINEYMEKEFFTEIDEGNGIEFIVEPLGEAQNEGIEKIIVNSLDHRSLKSEENIEKVLEGIKGKPWIILTGIHIFEFFYDKKGSVKENIIIKSDLDKKYFEKYGEILEGIYKYNGVESPIYNLDSDKEGIFILDSNDIKEFVHYDPNFKIQDREGVEEELEKPIGYASLKITDTKKIIEYEGRKKVLKDGSLKENEIVGEKLKEYIENIKKFEKSFDGNNLEDIIKYEGEKIILNYEILKQYETSEEKLNQFKQLVWIEFNQKGELKLKDDAVVYKVEFNG